MIDLKIIELNSKNIPLLASLAADVLIEGETIVYPTDTVYGIGADALNEKAVDKIREVKMIPEKKPFSAMFSDMKMIKEYCELNASDEKKLEKYLPGPYTILLPLKSNVKIACANEKIGVRIPENPFCNQLCKSFGKPIVTTSANVTGFPPPTDFDTISMRILNEVSIAIDGGQTKYQKASQIIDFKTKKIIR